MKEGRKEDKNPSITATRAGTQCFWEPTALFVHEANMRSYLVVIIKIKKYISALCLELLCQCGMCAFLVTDCGTQ
jgi:hypothetical protein